MKLSTRGRYGARALVELARHRGQGPLALKEMAERQQIPLKYLEQIAMVLKRAKLIKSIRGPSGGYTLSRPPEKINLLEIIEALEGSLSFVNCVKDPSTCRRVESCAFNDLWKKISVETSKILRSVTLADMVRKDSQKKSSLASCFEEQVFSEHSR
jgi:Rrf2 family cysteine metabolism transcriptional repressor